MNQNAIVSRWFLSTKLLVVVVVVVVMNGKVKSENVFSVSVCNRTENTPRKPCCISFVHKNLTHELAYSVQRICTEIESNAPHKKAALLRYYY